MDALNFLAFAPSRRASSGEQRVAPFHFGLNYMFPRAKQEQSGDQQFLI